MPCDGRTRQSSGRARYCASERRKSPSGSASGSDDQTPITGEIRGRIWSAAISRFALGAVQRHLLRRVALADQHLPAAARHRDLLPGPKPGEHGRRLADHATIGVTARLLAGDDVLRQSRRAGSCGPSRPRRPPLCPSASARQVSHSVRLIHSSAPVSRAQPAGQPGMIGMEVRHQDPVHRPPGQHPAEHGLPHGARRRIAVAGVDDGPAVAVVAQPEVDMIQRQRQTHPEPQNAFANRRWLAELRCWMKI